MSLSSHSSPLPVLLQGSDDQGRARKWNLQSVELLNVDTGVASLYHLAGWVEGGVQIARMVRAFCSA